MLCGEAAVGIWNGIAPEGRAAFYDWHLKEHMPERAGIPGFRRGRRYIAADQSTHPEFFTLYEVDTMQVLQGSDYLNRLNQPTPWTRETTAFFRDTSRVLARVACSAGPGMGGYALTLSSGEAPGPESRMRALVQEVATSPRITGAHLCLGDAAASDARTAESKGRTDIQAPPAWFILLEATDPEALAHMLPETALHAADASGPFSRGVYRCEYTRGKTAFAP